MKTTSISRKQAVLLMFTCNVTLHSQRTIKRKLIVTSKSIINSFRKTVQFVKCQQKKNDTLMIFILAILVYKLENESLNS